AAKRMDFRAVAVCHNRRDSAVDLFHGIADKDFNLLIPGWRGNIHSVEPTAVKELKEVENCVLGRMAFILCKAVDRCCTLRKLTGKSAQSQSASQARGITAVDTSNLAVVLYKRYGAATPTFRSAFDLNLKQITMSVKPGSLMEPMAVDYVDASEKALVLYKRHDVDQCYQPIMHSVQSIGSFKSSAINDSGVSSRALVVYRRHDNRLPTFQNARGDCSIFRAVKKLVQPNKCMVSATANDMSSRAASLHKVNGIFINTLENLCQCYLMFKTVHLANELNTFIECTAANNFRMASKTDAFYNENVCSEPLREEWSSVARPLEPISQATRLRKLRLADVNKVFLGTENAERFATEDVEGRTAALWRRRERQSFTKTTDYIEPSEAVSEEIENALSIMMFQFAEKKSEWSIP
ncbi:hypothetical protein HDU67_003056, partial [Dinochytrium kinnereticum]